MTGRLRDTWPLTWRDLGKLAGAYVALTLAFILIGLPLRRSDEHRGIGRIDHEISLWMVDHRDTTTNTLSFVGSGLADTIVKVVVTAAIVLTMLRVWHRWFEAAYVAIVLILEASVFITVTFIVARPRPTVPHLETSEVTTSFPSGHTAAAVAYGAVAFVTFWHTRRRAPRAIACVVCTLIPIIVGVSRVHRGVHHTSDVVAGALLGLATLLITTRILVRAQERLETGPGGSSALPGRSAWGTPIDGVARTR